MQKVVNYKAYINYQGKQHHLGSYKTEAEAAHAFNLKADEFYPGVGDRNDVIPVSLNPLPNNLPGKSGYTGVRLLKSGKYSARVKRNGVEKYLGVFDNLEDAINVREQFLNS